jgi:type IV pilus assembly protein PilV
MELSMTHYSLIRRTQRSRVTGFTLLEVLVAVLILSIGLLGLAGLQTHSLRNNQASLQRSQAVTLAYDALDRMRSNRTAALATGSVFITDFDDAETVPDCASGCDVTQTAQYHVGSWKREVARLPGPGAGRIAINSGRATVQVRWVDNRDGATSTFTVESLL